MKKGSFSSKRPGNSNRDVRKRAKKRSSRNIYVYWAQQVRKKLALLDSNSILEKTFLDDLLNGLDVLTVPEAIQLLKKRLSPQDAKDLKKEALHTMALQRIFD